MRKLCGPLLLWVCFTGCVAPSNEARRASYVASRHAFTGDFAKVVAATYHLISVETDFKSISLDPRTGKLSGEYGDDRHFKEGLCVGIDASGYLLTAAHVVGKFCYVMGDFEGQWGFRRARVVKKPPRGTQGGDFAVLKVDTTIHALPYATDVAPEQRVFAVVFVKGGEIGGGLDRAAGRVKGVQRDPAGVAAELVDTTVPLRAGDSGGPLVDEYGALVGIAQGWQLEGNMLAWQYRRLTCRPQWKVLEEMMRTDRVTHG